MVTDEQAAARKAALKREKAGYENRLGVARRDGDSDKVERYQGLIKGVEKALKDFDSQGGSLIDGSVDDVLERVGDDPDLARQALELESSQKKPRTSLVKGLEAILEDEEE